MNKSLDTRGDELVAELTEQHGKKVGIVLIVLHDGGHIEVTSNMQPDPYADFIAWFAEQTAAGDIVFEQGGSKH